MGLLGFQMRHPAPWAIAAAVVSAVPACYHGKRKPDEQPLDFTKTANPHRLATDLILQYKVNLSNFDMHS